MSLLSNQIHLDPRLESVDDNQDIQHAVNLRPSWRACAIGQFNSTLEDPADISESDEPLGLLVKARFPEVVAENLAGVWDRSYTYGSLKQFIQDNEL